MAHRKQIEAEANAFRIWREGSAVEWDCTLTELADAVGLTKPTVWRICQDKGWTTRLPDREKVAGHHAPSPMASHSLTEVLSAA